MTDETKRETDDNPSKSKSREVPGYARAALTRFLGQGREAQAKGKETQRIEAAPAEPAPEPEAEAGPPMVEEPPASVQEEVGPAEAPAPAPRVEVVAPPPEPVVIEEPVPAEPAAVGALAQKTDESWDDLQREQAKHAKTKEEILAERAAGVHRRRWEQVTQHYRELMAGDEVHSGLDTLTGRLELVEDYFAKLRSLNPRFGKKIEAKQRLLREQGRIDELRRIAAASETVATDLKQREQHLEISEQSLGTIKELLSQFEAIEVDCEAAFRQAEGLMRDEPIEYWKGELAREREELTQKLRETREEYELAVMRAEDVRALLPWSTWKQHQKLEDLELRLPEILSGLEGRERQVASDEPIHDRKLIDDHLEKLAGSIGLYTKDLETLQQAMETRRDQPSASDATDAEEGPEDQPFTVKGPPVQVSPTPRQATRQISEPKRAEPPVPPKPAEPPAPAPAPAAPTPPHIETAAPQESGVSDETFGDERGRKHLKTAITTIRKAVPTDLDDAVIEAKLATVKVAEFTAKMGDAAYLHSLIGASEAPTEPAPQPPPAETPPPPAPAPEPEPPAAEPTIEGAPPAADAPAQPAAPAPGAVDHTNLEAGVGGTDEAPPEEQTPPAGN